MSDNVFTIGLKDLQETDPTDDMPGYLFMIMSYQPLSLKDLLGMTSRIAFDE